MDLSDPRTFARIYDENQKSVHATAYRVLGNAAQAQDVVQDVFLRVWRAPGKFDARRGDVGAYLRLMARSRAVDLWREGQAAGRAGDRLKVAVTQEPPRRDERPDDAALAEADSSTLRDALRVLPGPQREAIVLAYWGGLTADEIARRREIPLGTVKSRLRLGLARLRGELAELGESAAVAA